MQCLSQMITQITGRFGRREEGAVAVEAIIILPMVFWSYLAMFSFFDAFREYTNNQKAAYTISDLVSRQATPLDNSFLDGTHQLFDTLTRPAGATSLRVSVVSYDLPTETYSVIWSHTRGAMEPLETSDITGWANRLPVMPDDDQIIVVETQADFNAFFNIGLGTRDITNFVFTRPRYASKLCWQEICD